MREPRPMQLMCRVSPRGFAADAFSAPTTAPYLSVLIVAPVYAISVNLRVHGVMEPLAKRSRLRGPSFTAGSGQRARTFSISHRMRSASGA
jgi:hypothetical protein